MYTPCQQQIFFVLARKEASMVYTDSSHNGAIPRGDKVKISEARSIEILGISRSTFIKWKLLKKFKSYKKLVAGRFHYEYDEREMRNLRERMSKKREKGKPYLL